MKKYYIFRLNTNSFIMNFLSVLIIIIFIIFSIILLSNFNILDINYGVFILCLFGYFILHEIVHSIAYVIYGGKFNKIVYGIKLESGVFYCLCKQNISKKAILYASIYPLIFLGIIPYMVGIIINNQLVVLLSIFNISGSIADIYTFIYILKLNDGIEFSEMDNPLYFAIYSEYDVSKIKHTGISYVKSSKYIDRNNLKKITISKWSYIILIIFIIIIILMWR